MSPENEPAGPQLSTTDIRPSSTAVKAAGSNRRTMIRVVAGLAAVIALVATFMHWRGTRQQSTDDAFIEGHVVPVSARVAGHVAEVLVTDNQYVEAGAMLVRLDDRDAQTTYAAAQGNLESARAELKQMELDVQVSEIETSATLQQAKAGIDGAKARIVQAEAAVAGAENAVTRQEAAAQHATADLQAMRSQHDAAKARAARAAADLKREGDLLKNGSISQAEMDRAEEGARVAAAEEESARRNVSAMESSAAESAASLNEQHQTLREKHAMLEAAKADLSRAEAQAHDAQAGAARLASKKAERDTSAAKVALAEGLTEKMRLTLSFSEIRAPRAGTVTRRTVEPGAYVQPGQALLALVSSDVWVIANFKETQLANMHPGALARIEVDACPGREFEGHVESFQRGSGARFSLLPAENATGNYIKVAQRIPVKIVFDKPGELKDCFLVPGLSAVPTVYLKRDAPADVMQHAAPVPPPSSQDATPPAGL